MSIPIVVSSERGNSGSKPDYSDRKPYLLNANAGDTVTFTGTTKSKYPKNEHGSFLHVEDISAYLWEKFGIRSKLGDDLNQANWLVDGIEKVHEKGYKFPENLVIMCADDTVFDKENTAAFFFTKPGIWGSRIEETPIIWLRSDFVKSSVSQPVLQEIRKKHALREGKPLPSNGNLCSLNDLATDLYHEIGHCLHKNTSRKIYNAIERDLDPDTEELRSTSKYYEEFVKVKELITQKISKYAATNPLEFVAEMFSGKMIGNDYSSEPKLMELYKKYGGPMPFEHKLGGYFKIFT
jgi:hypothetical protein